MIDKLDYRATTTAIHHRYLRSSKRPHILRCPKMTRTQHLASLDQVLRLTHNYDRCCSIWKMKLKIASFQIGFTFFSEVFTVLFCDQQTMVPVVKKNSTTKITRQNYISVDFSRVFFFLLFVFSVLPVSASRFNRNVDLCRPRQENNSRLVHYAPRSQMEKNRSAHVSTCLR